MLGYFLHACSVACIIMEKILCQSKKMMETESMDQGSSSSVTVTAAGCGVKAGVQFFKKKKSKNKR